MPSDRWWSVYYAGLQQQQAQQAAQAAQAAQQQQQAAAAAQAAAASQTAAPAMAQAAPTETSTTVVGQPAPPAPPPPIPIRREGTQWNEDTMGPQARRQGRYDTLLTGEEYQGIPAFGRNKTLLGQ